MNVAILKVNVADDGRSLKFVVTCDGQEKGEFSTELPAYNTIHELSSAFYVTRIINQEMRVLLKQWMLDNGGQGVIAIDSDDAEVHAFQWELMPSYVELFDASVVRMHSADGSGSSWSVEPSLLVAGWPNADIPFVDRELASLSSIGAESKTQIDVLTCPSTHELVARLGARKPTILHLIPQATYVKDGEVEFSNGPDDFVSVKGLANAIRSEHSPNLVVINNCDSGSTRDGTSAASLFNKALGCMAVGWSSNVEDAVAADFAAFLYRRLSEGSTVIRAIKKFIDLDSMVRQTSVATRGVSFALPMRFVTPVVWCPSEEAMDLTFKTPASELELSRDRGGSPRRSGRSGRDQTERKIPDSDSPKVRVELELRNALNPALLINGTAPITRLALDASAPVSNLALEVSCDTGIGRSTVKQSVDLLAGPQPIKVEKFQFPALYELAEGSPRRRLINFTVTCSIDGRLVNQDTKSVLWMGLKEWLDRPEVWPYVPAFVLPNANGVLDVIDLADKMLKTIDSPESSFDGYQSGENDHVSKQMEAIFNMLRTEFSLSYINPPSSPIYEPESSMSSGQLVRFPDEVTERKRGTCHDLALFFAGCAEHVGIFPLVILRKDHTFFGFWNDQDEHIDFWENILEQRKEQGRPANLFGSRWCMTDKEELVGLVESSAVTLVEATDATNHNATYANAVEHGGDRLHQCHELDFDIAVDISASRRLIQPI